MSWWAVGITAVLGAKKGMDNEARMDKNDKFRKASIAMSPWTGMGDPGSQQLPGMLESGVQGGLTGAMLGSSMGASGGAATAGSGAATAGGTAGTTTALGNGISLGGAEQAAKIGAMNYAPAAASSLKYTGMGAQAGSAGALGAGANNSLAGMQYPQDPNDPYNLKYMGMGQP